MRSIKKKELKLWQWFLISRIPVLIILIIELLFDRGKFFLDFFDSEHYLRIAEHGYQVPYLYAFFPLYPLLMRLFGEIIGYKIAGFLISNICAYFSLKILVKLNSNKDIIIRYLFSPILIYMSIIYTESLFVFLCLLAYYLYKNKKYLFTSLIIGLSILTRNSGFIMLLAIGIDIIYRKYFIKEEKCPLWKIICYALIACFIGILFPLYLYNNYNDALAFVTVQGIFWGRKMMTPFQSVYLDFVRIVKKGYDPLLFYVVILNWTSYVYAIVVGIKIFKKDLVASLFLLFSVLAFSFSFRDIVIMGSISSASLFRYIFGLFPLYIYYVDTKKHVFTIISIFLAIYNCFLVYFNFFLA